MNTYVVINQYREIYFRGNKEECGRMAGTLNAQSKGAGDWARWQGESYNDLRYEVVSEEEYEDSSRHETAHMQLAEAEG